MLVRNEQERAKLIEGGKRLAVVLRKLRERAVAGVTAEALDDYAEELIRAYGDTPAFLGYAPEGAPRAYPATLCVSINDEIVHGIPNESEKVLREGDIVTLDLGLIHEDVVLDAAITVAVGQASEKTKRFFRATEEALAAGIAEALPGAHVGDISHAVQGVIERAGYSVIKALGGHGVGDAVHEEPFIPNYGKKGEGELLEAGMVLAIEPIASEGKGAVAPVTDGYTFRTKDGSRAAHFEHTIIVEEGGARILTQE
jgi:methionyl aminopeptidase